MFSNGKPGASARAVLHGVHQGTTMAALVTLSLAVTAAFAATTNGGSGPSVAAEVLSWLERWQGALALAGFAIAIWAGLARGNLAALLGGLTLAMGATYLPGLATPLMSGTF